MPTEILMPALSPTMEEGTLAKWLVKEGDTVASGDVMAEIETDKATMEFEAVDEGVIGKIVVPEGTEGVKVNDVIAVLLEDGESADDIGEVPSGGDDASSNAAPAEASEKTAPEKGYGRGETEATPAPAAGSKDGERIFASPLARRIAADKGLDLKDISGSGPKGRIVKADVENAQPSEKKAAAPKSDAPIAAASAPAAMASGPSTDAVIKTYEGRPYEEVKLDGMRKTIAARLTEAKQSVPHFYLRRDIMLDDLLKFRGQLNKQLESRGVKLSVNDFIIKKTTGGPKRFRPKTREELENEIASLNRKVIRLKKTANAAIKTVPETVTREPDIPRIIEEEEKKQDPVSDGQVMELLNQVDKLKDTLESRDVHINNQMNQIEQLLSKIQALEE